ncbi:MAG: hypothetical protein AB8I08_31635 [Sandaracinaceae bacterium]
MGSPRFDANDGAAPQVASAFLARVAELSTGPELTVGHTRERVVDGVRESYVCSREIAPDAAAYPAAFVSRLHSNVFGGSRLQVERVEGAEAQPPQ